MRARENLDQFIADALGADDLNLGGHFLHCLKRCGFDLIRQIGGEAHTPQQPQLVLGEPLDRVANGSHQFPRDVSASIDEIDKLARDGIVEQPIDREIAAVRIFFRRTIADTGGPPSVDVGVVAAKRRDLELVAILDDHHYAEGGANRYRFREQRLYLLRRGARRDVDVVRFNAAHHVTDAPAVKIGGVARFAQAADNADRGFLHGGDTVIERVGGRKHPAELVPGFPIG